VDELVLVKELEQLGLPKGTLLPLACNCWWARLLTQLHELCNVCAEHAEAVGKPYSKDRERLRTALLASSLQLVRALLAGRECSQLLHCADRAVICSARACTTHSNTGSSRAGK
jgi:hypothetical protein